MADLRDGESVEMAGSPSRPNLLKNFGGVYSCSCPAWRHQSLPIERRTCKHLRQLRGDDVEAARVGGELPTRPAKPTGVAKIAAPRLCWRKPGTGPLTLPAGGSPKSWNGVRGYWTGRQFQSRQGNAFHAPDWFTAGLPPVPLDGELWLGGRCSSGPSASSDGRT
jgi:DNA ligase-1